MGDVKEVPIEVAMVKQESEPGLNVPIAIVSDKVATDITIVDVGVSPVVITDIEPSNERSRILERVGGNNGSNNNDDDNDNDWENIDERFEKVSRFAGALQFWNGPSE